MIKKFLLFIFMLILLIVAYFIIKPSPIDPVAWTPPLAPELVGEYEQNNKLNDAIIFQVGGCNKCEDIAIDSVGRVFGGSLDGDIIMIDGDQRSVIANTGGRPLGLHFDHGGNLIIADADKGLLAMNSRGDIEVLVDEYEGVKLIFVDDLEIAADSMIYFSDASNKFGFELNALDILEGRGNGSLYSYNPQTKVTKELLDDLRFANGIAVAHDQSYVLVNETGRYRTHRYYLKGPMAGTSDLFIENLPGFPDGISQGENGLYWLALVSPRQQSLDDILPSPFLKNLVAKMPPSLQPKAVHYGFVLGLDSDGKVVYNLQDPKGTFAEITSVQQFGNDIYLGSLYENAIAKYTLQ